MFIGHFAVGLGAKALKPQVSLGTYFLAAQFVDLLWPTLLLFGVEQVAIAPGITEVTPLDFISYPISHSLVMAVGWAVAAFAIVYLLMKDFQAAVLVGICVASHWVLDFLTHRPDLPLTLGETTKVGLGLWNYRFKTVAIEVALFAAAIIVYLKATTAKDRIGKFAFWGLVVFLLLIYVGNIFGPPPPNVSGIAWAGHLQWLFVVWAYWVDKHRKDTYVILQPLNSE